MSYPATQSMRASAVVLRVLSLALLPCVAQGGVYKCVNGGEVSYQAVPCASGAAPYKETAGPEPQQPVRGVMAIAVPAGMHALAPMQAAPMVGSQSAQGAARPYVPGMPGAIGGSAAAVQARPPGKGLQGVAGYAEGRTELTPEQVKIGYALSTNDRAGALSLIKAAHDSLNFPVFRDMPDTPLIFATRIADTEMIAAILAKGLPVDTARTSSFRSGETALIAAVDSTFATHYGSGSVSPERFLETAHFLLKAGANPNAKRSDGAMPLNVALSLTPPKPEDEAVKIATIKALLEAGAHPGTELPTNDPEGEGEMEIMKLLLDHGFDPKAKGSTSLASAVQARKPALVKLLLFKGADPNAHSLMNPRRVVADADINIDKILLAAGANPNVCDNEDSSGKCSNYGRPLIFWAAQDPEFFHMIVAHGGNPNITDAQGQTALGYAINYRKQNITKVCIAGTNKCMDAPADPFDRVKAIRMLLDAGADPNLRSNKQLPLMMVYQDDHEVVSMLVEKGARIEALNVGGEKIGPITQAIASGNEFLAGELLRYAKKLGPEEKWALYGAAFQGKLELAEALTRHGVNPNERAPFGETALHYAAAMRHGNAAMIKRLLALGADPNAQTVALPEAALVNPQTGVPNNPGAPDKAAVMAWFAQVQAKQVAYASARLGPLQLGDGKVTPLMIAAMAGDTEAVQALLSGGAKASLKSQRGMSAAEIARQMGNQDMVRLLSGRP